MKSNNLEGGIHISKSWDSYCKEINCQQLYYVYGCEANCALENNNKKCNREKEIKNIKLQEFYQTPYGKVVKELEEVQEKLDKAYAMANNAIYFNDGSDYLTALYDVCYAIKPDCEDIGTKYIE